jgi:hypothetical protein
MYSQTPDKSGLPPAVLGAGALRSAFPSAVLGAFAFPYSGHCARAVALSIKPAMHTVRIYEH